MAGNARQVINMANSIVGVSILSMPFCFKETGLLLGVVLVLVSGFITKKTCMFLIRSAIMARRRSYEFLAFHVFGVSGKLFVEMCMILFLFGICISFYVVMGDLAPAIVARFMNVENSPSLRCTLLIGIAVLVVLPLCLLRNLDNLASMSACSIMFYFFLIVVIFWHAFPRLWDGSWIQIAELWRPAGALQVLPILSLALACQSNVFEIYDSVPDPDVPKMRFVVNHAVNLCSALYISVGFLGYVAFVDKDFSGNIIMSFPNSELTEGIKMFFTVSLAISFPLMIFPCRTSIHSLIYRRAIAEVQEVMLEDSEDGEEKEPYLVVIEDMSNPSSFDLVGNYMPEARFKAITIGILISSLIIGILIPSIELVLGLLGSTMGMLIATILPSLLFIKVHTKASAERLFAQAILLFGVMMIVMGTYLNLAHISETQVQVHTIATELPVVKGEAEPQLPNISDDTAKKGVDIPANIDAATRKEPVAPEPPPEENTDVKSEKEKDKYPGKIIDSKLDDMGSKKDEGNASAMREKKKEVKANDSDGEAKKHHNKNEQGDTLHPDAIQKEEHENEEEGDKVQQEKDIEKKQAEILEKMEEHNQKQQLILEEQQKILQELKDQKLKQEEDAKRQEETKEVSDVNNNQIEGAENAVAQGVALGGNQIKPELRLDNPSLEGQSAPRLESKDYQSQGGGGGVAHAIMAEEPLAPVNNPSLNNNIPVQSQQLGNQPALALDPKMVPANNLNNPSSDSKVAINPQLPMMYYNNLQNQVGDNQLNVPASAALPAVNQQYSAGNPPGQVVYVQSSPGLNAPVPQAFSAGLPNLPSAAKAPVQAGPIVNAPVQQAAGQVVPVQQAAGQVVPVQQAAGQFVPVQQAAGQVVPVQQGSPQQVLPAVKAPVQSAPVGYLPAQQIPVAYVPLQPAGIGNVPLPPAPIGNVLAQPAALANNLVQQPKVVDVPDQSGPVVNNFVQPPQAPNVLGQLSPAASGLAGSAPVQPGYAGNIAGQPPAVGLPAHASAASIQPVFAADSPVQSPSPDKHPDQNMAPPVNEGVRLPPASKTINQPSQLSDSHKDDKAELLSRKDKLKQNDKLIKDSISKDFESKHSKLPKPSSIKKKSDSSKKKVGKVDLPKQVPQDTLRKELEQDKEKLSDAKQDKKAQHDEERKKREAELDSNFDLPQADVLSEFKWKDIGDVAYDTRHLLWTGRSRRRKRNKGRDEEYYWDET